MELKSDGRKYSRILQRSIAIVKILTPNNLYKESLLVEEIFSSNLPEFYLKRFNRQISINRTRDYVRFLETINVLVEEQNDLKLSFSSPSTDLQWAQDFADKAHEFLAERLKIEAKDLEETLRNTITTINTNSQLPTIDKLSNHFNIKSGIDEERFRWGFYLYTDGPSCPFEIRHYPVLLEK